MRTALLWAHRLVDPLHETTGIGRYGVELARALRSDESEWSIVLGSRAERGAPAADPSGLPVRRMPGPRGAVALAWMTLGWPPVEHCGVDADVVHVLNVSFPVPSRTRTVYMIHDMMLMTHPEWYGRVERIGHQRAFAHARRHASAFIANSSFTADGAADLLDIDRDRITVVPLGVGDRYRPHIPDDEVALACERAEVTPGNYVIALGSMTPRKNLSMLVRALAIAGSSLDGVQLLFAGPRRQGAELLRREAVAAGLDDRVRVSGFVSEADLPALLAGALALAHPSLDEGFGLPPLEAMAVGTPAVVSTAGALPEVVGDAALLVSPHDDDAWASALAQVAADESARARLVERGYARAAGYRWERTARETRAVWDRVVAHDSQ